MAKAGIDKKIVVTETVTLDLSREEAEVIALFAWKAGGTRDGSSRRYTVAIEAALASVDIHAGERLRVKHGLTGSVYFIDQE